MLPFPLSLREIDTFTNASPYPLQASKPESALVAHEIKRQTRSQSILRAVKMLACQILLRALI